LGTWVEREILHVIFGNQWRSIFYVMVIIDDNPASRR